MGVHVVGPQAFISSQGYGAFRPLVYIGIQERECNMCCQIHHNLPLGEAKGDIKRPLERFFYALLIPSYHLLSRRETFHITTIDEPSWDKRHFHLNSEGKQLGKVYRYEVYHLSSSKSGEADKMRLLSCVELT